MKRRLTMIMLISVFLLTIVRLPVYCNDSIIPNDDFNDNEIDINRWLVFINGHGSVVETNQELQIELTSDNSVIFSAGIVSNWTIGGDFDVQVDYRLMNWPEQNGIRITMLAGPPTTSGYSDRVHRISTEPTWGAGEVYLTEFADGVSEPIPTTHATGKLRLVRTGSMMTGYYFDGNWVAIHSAHTATGNGSVSLMIWGTDSTPEVSVAFDNFIVNCGQISEIDMEEEVYTPSEIEPHFKMHVLYIRDEYVHSLSTVKQTLRMMAENLAGMGIEVHLNFVWAEQFIAYLLSGKLYEEGGYDAAFFSWMPDYAFDTVFSTAQWMCALYHSSNMIGSGTGYNVLLWNNTQNDGILNTAVTSTDEEEVGNLLHEWQAFFFDEQPSAIVYYRNDSEFGPLSVFGQVSFNMHHPVFGTGADTPLGKSDPNRATESAKYVRQAISHTIDRTFVVNNIAEPEYQPLQEGVTPVSPSMPSFDSSLQPYALNLTEARRLLSLAGYGMTITGGSPINLWVTDSSGRCVGVNPETGEAKIEIPWAYYSGKDSEPQVISIPWPSGQYYIKIVGTASGSYTLKITRVTEETFSSNIFEDLIHTYVSFTTATESKTTLLADIDPEPKTLNLRSRGEWITCYIELPEGYDVNDINVSTMMLNDTIPAQMHPTGIDDEDNDGVPDLMVKFDRAEVASYIIANVNMTKLYEERFMTITLTITGYLNDDTPFEGSHTVRIKSPLSRGLKKLAYSPFF